MSSNTNFATFNPSSSQAGNGAIGSAYNDLDKGNTEFYVSNGSSGMAINIATPSSGGKWYCEFYLSGSVGNYAYVGYYPIRETPEVKEQWAPSGNTTWVDTGIVSVHSMGRYFYTENQYTDSGATSFTAGDVISIALDLDNGATYFAKNGTYMNSGNPASGSSKTGAAPVEGSYSKQYLLAVGSAGSSGHTWTINAGQDSTFNGALSAGGNTDANGFGDFKYTVPSGYLSLCSANVPVNTNQDPSQDTPPNNSFETVTYSGNGSTQSISSLNFQPDTIWIKNRDQTDAWCVQDDINGVGKIKAMDSAAPYASETNNITAFNSNGFSLGNNHRVNASGEDYVAYCFKESQEAGLDMFAYTGVGDGTTVVSHNLGETPKMVWIFLVSGSNTDTMVYIDTPDMGTSYGIFPSLNNARQATSYVAATSSSNITVGSSANATGRGYFAMLWAEREGFSRYDQYEGNGNSYGPFVYTGFRPRFLWIKRVDSSGGWHVFDTGRNTFNPVNTYLLFDTTGADDGPYASNTIDFLSNGFKIRNSANGLNANGSKYIFGAWGDVPFKFNNAF